MKTTEIKRNGGNGSYIAILKQTTNFKDGTSYEQVLDMKFYQTKKGAEKKLKEWGV
jgi:hypothetical protein